VFITGLEDGLLPHSRSLDDGEELAEERRLLYVGITRAKDRVYLSHAFRRSFYGDSSVSVPSRFLVDIPQDLVEGGNPGLRRQQSRRRASSWSTSTPSPPAAESRKRKPLPKPRFLEPDQAVDESRLAGGEPHYRSGQRVKHSKFGEGMVIESKLTGNDEEVVVAFPEGVKRLAASFANLEVLE
jgi:DNA helicase-2/ATP-dependent DNA helicase PcrA